MLEQIGNECIEVNLELVSLNTKIWQTFELEDLHLLALVADNAAASLLAGTLVVDAAYLNVNALALAFSTILGATGIAVHRRVLRHVACTLEVIVEVDLFRLD